MTMTAHCAPFIGAAKDRPQAQSPQNIDRPRPPNSPRQKDQSVGAAKRPATHRDDAHFAKINLFTEAFRYPTALEGREIEAAPSEDGFEERSEAAAACAVA